MNETADFGDYKNQAVNCTNLFEGVYTYDCPASSDIAGYSECTAFKSAIKTTIGNVVAQDKCANDKEDCDRKNTFKMMVFRDYHNHNIFKIRNGPLGISYMFLCLYLRLILENFDPDKNQYIS